MTGAKVDRKKVKKERKHIFFTSHMNFSPSGPSGGAAREKTIEFRAWCDPAHVAAVKSKK